MRGCSGVSRDKVNGSFGVLDSGLELGDEVLLLAVVTVFVVEVELNAEAFFDLEVSLIESLLNGVAFGCFFVYCKLGVTCCPVVNVELSLLP